MRHDQQGTFFEIARDGERTQVYIFYFNITLPPSLSGSPICAQCSHKTLTFLLYNILATQLDEIIIFATLPKCGLATTFGVKILFRGPML
jgi:hypothetical protein